MQIWSFFSKACIYYLLSLLIYESGGLGSWWQYVGFFPSCAHDTAAVYIGISARRDKTHTVNSLDFDCPQHQGLPLFKSKYLTEVFDRRSAIILHFVVWRFHRCPTTELNHQVRGCPLAGEPSKCTSPLCSVAHYVVSALILHKWDAHHRLLARSISQPCNTCRHKMVLMPRLVFSPGRSLNSSGLRVIACVRSKPMFQHRYASADVLTVRKRGQWECVCVLILSVLAAWPCLNIWGWQSRTHTLSLCCQPRFSPAPSLVSAELNRGAAAVESVCSSDKGQQPTASQFCPGVFHF